MRAVLSHKWNETQGIDELLSSTKDGFCLNMLSD